MFCSCKAGEVLYWRSAVLFPDWNIVELNCILTWYRVGVLDECLSDVFFLRLGFTSEVCSSVFVFRPWSIVHLTRFKRIRPYTHSLLLSPKIHTRNRMASQAQAFSWVSLRHLQPLDKWVYCCNSIIRSMITPQISLTLLKVIMFGIQPEDLMPGRYWRRLV